MSRFEWERLIRRLDLSFSTASLGLFLATYAEDDGSRIFPGNERLAKVAGVGLATVKRHMNKLRDMGLIVRVKHGNRHAGQADEYQLTVPVELLERVSLLDPGEQIRVSPMAPTIVDNSMSRAQVMSPEHSSDLADSGMSRAHLEMSRAHSSACLGLTGEPPPTHYQPHTNPNHLGNVSTDRKSEIVDNSNSIGNVATVRPPSLAYAGWKATKNGRAG